MSIFRPVIRERQASLQRLRHERIRQRRNEGRLFLQFKARAPWPRPHRLNPLLLSMSTRQINSCLQQTNTVSCVGCGITVVATLATIPELLSRPSIGLCTKRSDLGNNAVDRTRARKRVRAAAVRACSGCGLAGVQYVFRLSAPVLFLSPKDIVAEIHYAMTALADQQMARRPKPLALPGCMTIADLRRRLPDWDQIVAHPAGQYAASLYSGSHWDGSWRTIVDQVRRLTERAATDAIVAKAMAMKGPGDFRGTHHVKRHCQRCQYQSHLLRYFIGKGKAGPAGIPRAGRTRPPGLCLLSSLTAGLSLLSA